ncbi:MAG: ABC transporter ATP-binding protein, partial [Clostridia bacterium]|nr:ABC transporter ATP-binding protein [Clostridia bacterium]
DKYVKAMDEALDRVRNVMGTLDNLIWNIISLLCNSLLLFVIDPWLIVFGVFPLVLGFVRRWGNRLKHDHAAADKFLKRRNQYVRRTFYLNDYAKEMRIGGMHERMLRELTEVYRDAKALWRKYGIKRGIARFLQNAGLEVVTVLGAMTYAVWRTTGVGAMSIGDCIVILNSIGTISYCLNTMVQTFAEFGEHALFLEDVRYFLDYEPKMQEDPTAPVALGGDIVMEHVDFRYEGAEEDTLHDISLHIKVGEHIALVGQNGSGKTTLVKLLLRLYDPTGGVIRLDGRDIKEYRLSSYRDHYSCVLQDFKVFSLSVRENVVLRRPCEEDAALVTDALHESGAWGKIETLEAGIESTLTREFDDEGINLSVGEQQKVSLARVFAERTPCVILDEPSSALDPIAEHLMFENMMRAAHGRSVIFISHRLSSAVDADRIYLMDHGRITEMGSHRELMEKNGRYAEMFRLQAENYIGREVSAP